MLRAMVLRGLRSCHEILGLTPQASKEELKLRYHKLARNLHPDVCPAGTPQPPGEFECFFALPFSCSVCSPYPDGSQVPGELCRAGRSLRHLPAPCAVRQGLRTCRLRALQGKPRVGSLRLCRAAAFLYEAFQEPELKLEPTTRPCRERGQPDRAVACLEPQRRNHHVQERVSGPALEVEDQGASDDFRATESQRLP